MLFCDDTERDYGDLETAASYEDEMGYLTLLNDSAYELITADKADIEAIVTRFTLSLAN